MKVEEYIEAHMETLFHIYEGNPEIWCACHECGEIVRQDFISSSEYNAEHKFCCEYCTKQWEDRHSHDYEEIA